MTRYRVIVTRRADIHLATLHAFVHERDGPWKAASAVRKLVEACGKLESVPMRGVKRPDLGEGLRSWKAAKRATIVFEIVEADKAVLIHGIFTGGRNIERYFKRH